MGFSVRAVVGNHGLVLTGQAEGQISKDARGLANEAQLREIPGGAGLDGGAQAEDRRHGDVAQRCGGRRRGTSNTSGGRGALALAPLELQQVAQQAELTLVEGRARGDRLGAVGLIGQGHVVSAGEHAQIEHGQELHAGPVKNLTVPTKNALDGPTGGVADLRRGERVAGAVDDGGPVALLLDGAELQVEEAGVDGGVATVSLATIVRDGCQRVRGEGLGRPSEVDQPVVGNGAIDDDVGGVGTVVLTLKLVVVENAPVFRGLALVGVVVLEATGIGVGVVAVQVHATGSREKAAIDGGSLATSAAEEPFRLGLIRAGVETGQVGRALGERRSGRRAGGVGGGGSGGDNKAHATDGCGECSDSCTLPNRTRENPRFLRPKASNLDVRDTSVSTPENDHSRLASSTPLREAPPRSGGN